MVLLSDKNLVDITITKRLILEENDHAIKTRIPGMWGENARYLWINKENAIHEKIALEKSKNAVDIG